MKMRFPFFFVSLLLPSVEVAGAHLADTDRLWTGGVVEFKFYKTFLLEHQLVMKKAMLYITSSTPCVTFVPATSSSVNFVLIIPGAKCASELGMQGGQQMITLNSACFRDGIRVPVHQLLHTLGFVGEHTRPDRDDFITLNVDNIRPGLEHHFAKRPYGDAEFHTSGSVNHQHTPYDFFSVLHYGPLEGSKDGSSEVINYRFGLPDETWPEPYPDDPLSLIDKVELSLTYACEDSLGTAKILEYIHHNRNLNTMMINTIALKMEEKTTELAKENSKLAEKIQMIERQIEKLIE